VRNPYRLDTLLNANHCKGSRFSKTLKRTVCNVTCWAYRMRCCFECESIGKCIEIDKVRVCVDIHNHRKIWPGNKAPSSIT
jgi:hypothetical protein